MAPGAYQDSEQHFATLFGGIIVRRKNVFEKLALAGVASVEDGMLRDAELSSGRPRLSTRQAPTPAPSAQKQGEEVVSLQVYCAGLAPWDVEW